MATMRITFDSTPIISVCMSAMGTVPSQSSTQTETRSRKRIYASGGEGAISVFEQQDADHYKEGSRIATVKGARTSFFSPDLGRLYLAARRQGSSPAMIQVFEASR